MPARLRRLRSPRILVRALPGRSRRALIPVVLGLLAVTAIGAGPVGAGGGDSRDLYFSAGYERQIDGRTCTAASTAMMMNFIARRDLNLGQYTILRYEQPRDALNDAVQRGSDPLGWSRAATYFSRYTGRPTTYVWEAYDSVYNHAVLNGPSITPVVANRPGNVKRYGTRTSAVKAYPIAMTRIARDRRMTNCVNRRMAVMASVAIIVVT